MSNSTGDNPPHAKAKARYIEIESVEQFVCTMEWPDTDQPQSVVFTLDDTGLTLVPATAITATKSVPSTESARRDSTLALVAVAAIAAGGVVARYLASRPRKAPAPPTTVTGPALVREAIAETRGNTAAPIGVTGFGRQ